VVGYSKAPKAKASFQRLWREPVNTLDESHSHEGTATLGNEAIAVVVSGGKDEVGSSACAFIQP